MRIGVIYNLAENPTKGLEQDAVSDNEITDTLEHVISALEPEHETMPLQIRRDNLHLLTRNNFDFIFNLAEGFGRDPFGESWIASYLELQSLPYTGSNPTTLALCLDKAKTKAILQSQDLPTPHYHLFTSNSEKKDKLEFPLIVKPVHEDASIGITPNSVTHNEQELLGQVNFILSTYNQPALVEEFIDGKEINVSILGNKQPTALPICELVFNFDNLPKIASFDSKWVPDSLQHELMSRKCPADISSSLESKVKQLAVQAFNALECRDYARIDFRLKQDEPFILEVNPNPGINTDTSFFKSASTAGMSYKRMIQSILSSALARYPSHEERKELVYSGRRLSFSKIKKQDLPTLLQWFNDYELCKFMDDPESTYTLRQLTEDVLLDQKNLNLMVYSSGERIGYGSIYNLKGQSAEISFLIGKNHQGKGYGKELVRGLINIAFNNLNLASIATGVVTANEASLRLCRSLGFSIIGTRKNYHKFQNEFYDEAILELRKN